MKVYSILHISDLHRSPRDPISNDELISALPAQPQQRQCQLSGSFEPQMCLLGRLPATAWRGLVVCGQLASFAHAGQPSKLVHAIGSPPSPS
jgi:hypothetical protein